ncbi:MAG: A/G-specific adenine glycosylase [Patescibacteria group bacterium]
MPSTTTKLLAWYGTHQRVLPWRKTKNAYHVFVSELMLQQTQVDRVIPLYRAFLKKFPTWKNLANASTPDLIHAWSGLGYNRRALYARESARNVVSHGVPKNQDGWRKLKGVGPYMAAALAEFVNHERAVVMDTNVRRVVGRITLGLPYPALTDDIRIMPRLEQLTPTQGPHWDFPQALMDFANAVCLPSNPKCKTCPLRTTCKASKKFLSSNPPKRPKRISTERIHRDKTHPDRIYRGRILAWVKNHGATNIRVLGSCIDDAFDPIADQDWLHAMAQRLVTDGLLAWRGTSTLSLPAS